MFVARSAPDEPADDVVGSIEDLGGQQRFESGAAVDTRVPREKVLDAAEDTSECRRARSVIQEDVWTLAAVEQRHRGRDPDDILADV